MSAPKTTSYLIDAAFAETLSTSPLARLMPEISAVVPSSRFSVLDQFHRPLLRSDRLLLETGSELELTLPDATPLVVAGSACGQLVASLANERLRQALADLAPLRSLQPQVKGSMRRTTLSFRDANGKTHCRARLSDLQTESGERVVVLRLEGLRGYERSLSELRAHVQAEGAVPMSIAKLCTRLLPTWDRALAIRPVGASLFAHRRVFDVACDLVAAQLPVLRATEAGIIADFDTEYLHDYRVALRRIRSVVSLFKGVFDTDTTVALRSRFSELMAPTGRTRDLDVFLQDRDAIYSLVPQSLHSGLDEKFDLIARQRAAERARLVRHLRTPGYARDMEALTLLFETRSGLGRGSRSDVEMGSYARHMIWKRYRRMCARAAILNAATHDSDVHLLRIDGKKLRYLIEACAPLFPKEQLRDVMRPLKELQDCLGTINDCAVQQSSFRALMSVAARRKATSGTEMAQSVGALITVLHQRQVTERGEAMRLLAEFTHPSVGRSFKALFIARPRTPE